jgi:hypothetical protein
MQLVIVVAIFILVFDLAIVIPNLFENILAQIGEDTEIGGDPELGGELGMTESDMGGNDTGMTVSDIENDTK